jgi:hypothetical protein
VYSLSLSFPERQRGRDSSHLSGDKEKAKKAGEKFGRNRANINRIEEKRAC